MNAAQYRSHKSPPLRRAFFRGELAGVSGIALAANPYRQVLVTKKARRGSWSEAFSKAWATGWHHAHEGSRVVMPAAAGGSGAEKEREG